MSLIRIGLALFTLVSGTLLAQAGHAVGVEGMPKDAPLRLEARFEADALVLAIRMEPEWHLYGRETGGGLVVALEIVKGGAFRAAGPLVIPATESGRLEGSFELRQPLSSGAGGKGLEARFTYMACDPLACRLPATVTLRSEASTLPRSLRLLYVADGVNERSERIAKFLEKSGIEVTRSDYTKVDTATCDAHDVVLADSNSFRSTAKDSFRVALHFPKTKSPIVAVNFLGTELVENHGVAMTAGYI